MDHPRRFEPALLHTFKNHLTVIIGFCEIVLAELPEGELRKDIAEIHKASTAAIALVPQLVDHYHE